MADDHKTDSGKTTKLSRRTALARLGIGAAVAYSAPTVVHLDRSANAQLAVTPCARTGNKPPWCRGRDRRRKPR